VTGRTSADASERVLRLEPVGRRGLGLAELWERRELVYFFTWRDLKVRYKQTALGATWALLQPLVTMIVFSVFFGHLAKVPSSGLPYPPFVLCGLVPWTFFNTAVSAASTSLVTNANLLSKIYFPRLASPIASVAGSLVDLAIALLLMLVVAWGYGFAPTWRLLLLPLFILLALAACLGLGAWLAALTVQYRDVRFVLPFALQLGLLTTPVAYASSIVPSPWNLLYALNPMVSVVDGFRWAVLGLAIRSPGSMAISAGAAAVSLLLGIRFFRRHEPAFADVA
jgi:lipopolysaccharide transport system permease protein